MTGHNQATGPYAHETIEEYVCRGCGLRWKNVKRYDNHRLEDHV